MNDIQSLHPDYAEERIHHFRTNTKKLRAWLRAAGLEDLLTGEYKKMYRAAGEVRDAQVLIIRLSEEKQNQPWFHLWLVGYICRKQKKLRNRLRSFDSEAWHSLRSSVEKKWVEPDADAWCTVKTSEIYQAVKGRISDTRIHEIRKMIKDVFYIRYHDKSGKQKRPNEVQLKKTESILGKYVDVCHSIALLKVYLIEEPNIQRCRQARSLLVNWQKNRQNVKKSILLLLKRKTIPGLPVSR